MVKKNKDSKNNPETSYSLADIAKRFRVVPKTIRNEIKRGRLKAIYIGRIIRITPEALAEYERRPNR